MQEWVATLADELAPRSVQKYWQVLAQVLDYSETSPNPTRHRSVKLPDVDVEEATPPSTEHFLALLGRLSERPRLPALSLEQTAARVAELRVWEWGTSTSLGPASARAGERQARHAPRALA